MRLDHLLSKSTTKNTPYWWGVSRVKDPLPVVGRVGCTTSVSPVNELDPLLGVRVPARKIYRHTIGL